MCHSLEWNHGSLAGINHVVTGCTFPSSRLARGTARTQRPRMPSRRALAARRAGPGCTGWRGSTKGRLRVSPWQHHRRPSCRGLASRRTVAPTRMPSTEGLDDAEIVDVELLVRFAAHSPARGVAVCPRTGAVYATAGNQVIQLKSPCEDDDSRRCEAPIPQQRAERTATPAAAPTAAAAPADSHPLWAPSSDEDGHDPVDAAPLPAAATGAEPAEAAGASAGLAPLSSCGSGWRAVAGGFDHPAGLAVSPGGEWLVVCDYWRNRLASVSLRPAASTIRYEVRTLVGQPASREGTFVPSGHDGLSLSLSVSLSLSLCLCLSHSLYLSYSLSGSRLCV